MHDEFSVPSEYAQAVDKIFDKESITKREFVDVCLFALKLVDKYWENRRGFAYGIAGMLSFPIVQNDPLLDEIGELFGELELPDAHVADSEDGVKERWQEVKELVLEADKKY